MVESFAHGLKKPMKKQVEDKAKWVWQVPFIDWGSQSLCPLLRLPLPQQASFLIPGLHLWAFQTSPMGRLQLFSGDCSELFDLPHSLASYQLHRTPGLVLENASKKPGDVWSVRGRGMPLWWLNSYFMGTAGEAGHTQAASDGTAALWSSPKKPVVHRASTQSLYQTMIHKTRNKKKTEK